jgi:hypothetical protein
VFPGHLIKFGLTVVAVVEELPLRSYGYVRHCRESEFGRKVATCYQGAAMDL